ncbi:SOS response-associated peptidase [Geomesophilobacter sediminis]|uniref:Abasic site processing protein n=1 Tax=Geomesophilobacter sediminis TaxID=2798584 RepID=A0A8J7J9A4_9BACT|nr:SOS response-associated peptidase [Geomesophilobacter sediminis]MBJ6726416.1 SOS response-associated peptidase [Geomesophilobacter sediminis]
MCGRFTIILPPEVLAEIFGLPELPRIEARYNIAPTQEVVVIRQNAEGLRQLVTMKWGLIPSWAKDPHIGNKLINARCESVHEKPAFRQAICTRRCVIPASGFYDWTHTDKKIPFYVSMADGSPMAFAGIWDSWKAPDGSRLESFTILTTNANSLIAPIHDRMPVILHPAEFDLWLDRDITEPEKLTRLYQPYPSDLLRAWPVSSLVNSPRNETPACIEQTVS